MRYKPLHQFRTEPTPAALAVATKITEEEFRDVYGFALLLDAIAEQARETERERVLSMGFWELFREFWKGRKLHRAE
jgi:hypothetical protein